MPTLRVIFGGMCLFAPYKTKKRMYIFLIDLRQPGEEFGRSLASHLPVVKFDPKNISAETPSGIPPIPSTVFGIWELDRVQFDFLPDGNPVPKDCLEYECFNPNTASHDTSVAGHSGQCFAHVASLEQACEGRPLKCRGRIAKEFLKADLPCPCRRILAARVLANCGTIRTLALSASDGRPLRWRFFPFFGDPGQKDHSQLIAAMVALDIPFKKFVELRAVKFHQDKAEERLHLVPAGTEQMIVSLLNEEEPTIVAGPRARRPRLWEPRNEDRIFELYARLLENPPSPLEMPIPVAEREEGAFPTDVIAGGSPPCSPTRSAPIQG